MAARVLKIYMDETAFSQNTHGYQISSPKIPPHQAPEQILQLRCFRAVLSQLLLEVAFSIAVCLKKKNRQCLRSAVFPFE